MTERQLPFLEIAKEGSVGLVVFVFNRFADGEIGSESAKLTHLGAITICALVYI